MKDKEKLTMEEHRQLGQLLKIANDKLCEASVSYKTKKEFRTCPETRALKYLAGARDMLEEVMFKDYPGEASTGIYYGER